MDTDEIFDDLTKDISDVTESISDEELDDIYLTEEEELMNRLMDEGDEYMLEGEYDPNWKNALLPKWSPRTFIIPNISWGDNIYTTANYKMIKARTEAGKKRIEKLKKKIAEEKKKGDNKNIQKIKDMQIRIVEIEDQMKRLTNRSNNIGNELKSAYKYSADTASNYGHNITNTAKRVGRGMKRPFANRKLKKDAKKGTFEGTSELFDIYAEEYGDDIEAISVAIENDYIFNDNVSDAVYNSLMEYCESLMECNDIDYEGEVDEQFSVSSMIPQVNTDPDVSSKDDLDDDVDYDIFGRPIEKIDEIAPAPEQSCFEQDQIIFSLTSEDADYDSVTCDCMDTLMEAAIPHINLLSKNTKKLIGEKAFYDTKYRFLQESGGPDDMLEYVGRKLNIIDNEFRRMDMSISERTRKLINESTEFLTEILDNSVFENDEIANVDIDKNSKPDTNEKKESDTKEPELDQNKNDMKKIIQPPKKQKLNTEAMDSVDLMDLGLTDLYRCKMYFESQLNELGRRNEPELLKGYQNKLKYINKKLGNKTFLEAAEMEEEFQPIIDQLNNKGYSVKFATSGDTSKVKKGDGKSDGVKDGKLYIDAMILFDDDYNIKKVPEGWVRQKVDGRDYIKPEEIKYKESDGTVDEAKEKWKQSFMSSLSTWAEEIPEIKSSSNSSTSGETDNDNSGETDTSSDVGDTGDNDGTDNTQTDGDTATDNTQTNTDDTSTNDENTDTNSTEQNTAQTDNGETTDNTDNVDNQTDEEKKKKEENGDTNVEEAYQELMEDLDFNISLFTS